MNDAASKCTHPHEHEDAMRRALSEMPPDEQLEKLVQTFKLFGDSTRLKILMTLSAGELCVCDIARMIGATQSGVSHQLRLLRAFRLVKARREGKSAYYSLDDIHVLSIIRAGQEHICE